MLYFTYFRIHHKCRKKESEGVPTISYLVPKFWAPRCCDSKGKFYLCPLWFRVKMVIWTEKYYLQESGTTPLPEVSFLGGGSDQKKKDIVGHKIRVVLIPLLKLPLTLFLWNSFRVQPLEIQNLFKLTSSCNFSTFIIDCQKPFECWPKFFDAPLALSDCFLPFDRTIHRVPNTSFNVLPHPGCNSSINGPNHLGLYLHGPLF